MMSDPEKPIQQTLSNLWRGSLLPLGSEAAPTMGLLRSPTGASPSPQSTVTWRAQLYPAPGSP
jgi:hypothetical protein